MSILTDLDPINARFVDETSADAYGKMSWTTPLILFLLAGLGLGAALYHGGSSAHEPERKMNTTSGGELKNVDAAPIPLNKTVAAPQAALISSLAPDPSQDDKIQQQVTDKKEEIPLVRKNQQQRKTAPSSADSGKKGQNKKQSKEAGREASKPSQRDVEIITAIVH